MTKCYALGMIKQSDGVVTIIDLRGFDEVSR